MRLKDLKVGDIIKYNFNNINYYQSFDINLNYPTSGEGCIIDINGEYVTLANGHKFWVKYIVSKLVPIEKCEIRTEYQEIHIEKENFWGQQACKCGAKSLSGITERYVWVCPKCQEKLSPKSFKFEFYPRYKSNLKDQPFYGGDNDGKFLRGYSKIFGRCAGNFDIPMPPWAEIDKIYTVEIKEKS